MAIKTSLTYKQIGKNLLRFHDQTFQVEEVPFELMLSVGASSTIVQRYREGRGTVATYAGLLIKGVVAYRGVATAELLSTLEEMKGEERVRKASPALLLVSDGVTLLGYDPVAEESYENGLDQLYLDYSFFTPMWGVSKYRGVEENPADVKAAEKMAKLHDEIRRENEFTSESNLNDLNLFMTRLLFCFFAEDTGIFANDLFTESVRKFTRPDALDLSDYLGDAFRVMNKELREEGVDSSLAHFPYVNGGLFGRDVAVPRLGIKARRLILECGSLDWKSINPDIFGSMIQAVVTPELRSGLGMHYTSVPNIMKLIGPLFLDELKEEVNRIERRFQDQKNLNEMGGSSAKEFAQQAKEAVRDCRTLLLRMSKMKFFDPACGSGNFLIITYKNIRLLENRILHLIQEATRELSMTSLMTIITIGQFYGIELDDFACETAILSLWLAEHQMNAQFSKEFGVVINALPLKSNSNIHHGNACRTDWNVVCPHTPDEEVFIMGNPPYLGRSLRNATHQEDMDLVFSSAISKYKDLDYIACWFFLAAKYIQDSNSECSLVSTNSICQGVQVSLMWDVLIKMNTQIKFAYTSFKWANNAKSNAGVICSIIGLTNKAYPKYKIYSDDKVRLVDNISPYLIDSKSLIVHPTKQIYSDIPQVTLGSAPKDDGGLIFSEQEYHEFIEKYPAYRKFLKKFVGSEEFINGSYRYVLYITDTGLDEAVANIEIKRRLEICRLMRANSKKAATKALASSPNHFGEDRHQESPSIIIPAVSSERRTYIPIGFVDKDTVISNSAFAIYDAPVWLFGVLTSKMHMSWVATVGGRLKSDYRYSAQLCYNTFPFPKISKEKREEIEEAANEVLDVREYHCGLTLAELYDPEKMPSDLREAHERLDRTVESCYQAAPFANDEERLACLFERYEKMTKGRG